MIYLFDLYGYRAKDVITMAGGADLLDEFVVVDNYWEIAITVGVQKYMQVCQGNGIKLMFVGSASDEDLRYLKVRFKDVIHGFILKANEYREIYKELGYVVGSFDWDVEKFDKVFVEDNWFDVKILRYFAGIDDKKVVIYFKDFRNDNIFKYYPKVDVGVGGFKDYKIDELKRFFEKIRKAKNEMFNNNRKVEVGASGS